MAEIEVIQADREAADELMLHIASLLPRGNFADLEAELAEHFARHRIASAPDIAEERDRLRHALEAVRACRIPAMAGTSIQGPYEVGESWSVSGLTALLPQIEATLTKGSSHAE